LEIPLKTEIDIEEAVENITKKKNLKSSMASNTR
jgi:hypothetical protein